MKETEITAYVKKDTTSFSCVCICVYVWYCVPMNTWTERGQQQVSSSMILTLFLETSLMGAGAHQLARLQAPMPQGSSASTSQRWHYRLVSLHLAFHMGAGDLPLNPSYLHSKHFTHWVLSQTPKYLTPMHSWNIKMSTTWGKNTYSYLKGKGLQTQPQFYKECFKSEENTGKKNIKALHWVTDKRRNPHS